MYLIFLDEYDADEIYEECTLELRAAVNSRIRLVFNSMMTRDIVTDYEKDDMLSDSTKPSCLKIFDVNSNFIRKQKQ